MNNYLNTAKTFVMTNQKTILISVAVAIVLYLAYTMFFKSGVQTGGYPQGYQSYPNAEGFNHQGENDSEPETYVDETTSEEGFYADQSPKKVVLFFAPWCPHCKDLISDDNAPWSRLEHKHQNNPNVKIEKVDCDAHPEVATKNSIKGFPTIKMFSNGKVFTYDGERTVEGFDQFIENPPAPDQ